jgi:dynein heavy chain
MEAGCIMFRVKPVMVNDPGKVGAKLKDYWQAAKSHVLNNPGKLLSDLVDFDKENIH